MKTFLTALAAAGLVAAPVLAQDAAMTCADFVALDAEGQAAAMAGMHGDTMGGDAAMATDDAAMATDDGAMATDDAAAADATAAADPATTTGDLAAEDNAMAGDDAAMATDDAAAIGDEVAATADAGATAGEGGDAMLTAVLDACASDPAMTVMDAMAMPAATE